jgi:hypothetical protein
VESKLDQGRIEATVECASDRHPKRVELRLPHPERHTPIRVNGGSYNQETENVTIEFFNGSAEVSMVFETLSNEPSLKA